MQIDNDTPFEVALLFGIGPGPRPVATVVVKATYAIGAGPLTVSATQEPVAYADEPLGETGVARWEADTAPFKPRADVIVAGSVYAPGGRAAPEVEAGVRVGERRCGIRCFGDRVWEKEVRASAPAPFVQMELGGHRAFGGVSPTGGFCAENPLGKGFVAATKKQDAKGVALANVEPLDKPVKSWNDHPEPVGFGVVGRTAASRLVALGTFDARWRTERSPLPPADFRFDYYNGAYRWLQFDGYLTGNEEIELLRLSAEGRLCFRLPGVTPQAVVHRFPPETPGAAGSSGQSPAAGPGAEAVELHLDTCLLRPDDRLVCLTWRGVVAITALEVPEVAGVVVRLRG